jgi:SlyX protein
MENRLVDLEIRYAHLERQLQELSEVVFAQQRQLDALTKQLKQFQSQLLEPNEAVPNEKPPHY